MASKLFVLFAAILIIFGCGGGGGGFGGQNATLVGRVLNVQNGGPINPPASVQSSGETVQTQADGSFQLTVPQGTTTVAVDAGAFGIFTFTFGAASGVTDVGDLWVGPQKVTLTGRVIDSTDGTAVAGAIVSFAGKQGTTNSVGTYRLENVAYSSTSLAAFWGIVGKVKANGYFDISFTASGETAVGGTVTLDDLRMTPDDGSSPPPFPFTIWGVISPSADAPGTIVTLKENGNPVRVYNVGADRAYYFWVVPGTYTIEARKGALAADDTATLNQTNEVVRRDMTLQ
jgi:hypothetical protein